jgi:hypothetical protein
VDRFGLEEVAGNQIGHGSGAATVVTEIDDDSIRLGQKGQGRLDNLQGVSTPGVLEGPQVEISHIAWQPLKPENSVVSVRSEAGRKLTRAHKGFLGRRSGTGARAGIALFEHQAQVTVVGDGAKVTRDQVSESSWVRDISVLTGLEASPKFLRERRAPVGIEVVLGQQFCDPLDGGYDLFFRELWR